MRSKFLLALLGCAVAFAPVPARSAAPDATPSATGSIQGRIHNLARGDYLNNARVTIAGGNLSTLTNEFGEYRIDGVPAGEATVTAFYSGLPEQSTKVVVSPGARVVRDFDLKPGAPGDIVKLEAFAVTASREMSESAMISPTFGR